MIFDKMNAFSSRLSEQSIIQINEKFALANLGNLHQIESDIEILRTALQDKIVITNSQKNYWEIREKTLYNLDPEIHYEELAQIQSQRLFFAMFLLDLKMRLHYVQQDFLGTFPGWTKYDEIVSLCIQYDTVFSVKRLDQNYMIGNPQKAKAAVKYHRAALFYLPIRYRLDISYVMTALHCQNGSLKKCYKRLPTKMKKNQHVCRVMKKLDEKKK